MNMIISLLRSWSKSKCTCKMKECRRKMRGDFLPPKTWGMARGRSYVHPSLFNCGNGSRTGGGLHTWTYDCSLLVYKHAQSLEAKLVRALRRGLVMKYCCWEACEIWCHHSKHVHMSACLPSTFQIAVAENDEDIDKAITNLGLRLGILNCKGVWHLVVTCFSTRRISILSLFFKTLHQLNRKT